VMLWWGAAGAAPLAFVKGLFMRMTRIKTDF